MESLKRVNIELQHDPEILLQCTYSKELKWQSPRDVCVLMVSAALFTMAKITETTHVYFIHKLIKIMNKEIV